MINTAVILAAGAGKRIRELIGEKPKGFIEISGITLIDRSVEILKEFGISKIIIVTGFQKEYYEKFASSKSEITLINNELYAESGSMYSLSLARNLIKSDFLLLESDILYERRAVEALLNVETENAILASGKTSSGDEVYIDNLGDRVVQITKDKSKVKQFGGELVGISKISFKMYENLLSYSDGIFQKNLNIEYESDSITAICNSYEVFYKKIENLAWVEIDNKNHFERARDLVFPIILENDKKYFNK